MTGTGLFWPFLLFSILFGLSMDYQVFLVSRIKDEWTRTKDNRVAVRRGLGGSGRVVVAGAASMFSVFISFVLADDTTIKMFGLALAVATRSISSRVIRVAVSSADLVSVTHHHTERGLWSDVSDSDPESCCSAISGVLPRDRVVMACCLVVE